MKRIMTAAATLVICTTASGSLAIAAPRAPGSLDTSFGGDGVVTTLIAPGPAEANAVAIQADGKIVTAGADNLLEGSRQKSRFALARYDVDGSMRT